AVAGGIEVPMVLGSRSTALRDGFGGFLGRALRAGDDVPVGASAPRAGLDLIAGRNVDLAANTPIRLMPAPDWRSMTAAAQADVLERPFTVSPHSNRMGIRLEGPA